MATSAELCQLSWVIERLMADPRRIVQRRSQLHMGQLVKYWDWAPASCVKLASRQ
ncbi:hypothetical protein J2W39_004515 [Variovorax paradoxus]|uniref:Uncharacterized protein n=1 Tax=Variovorax paradoxus TaxID=34073 RepID=A0AAW8EKA6_VARPD|nr:hypothetical protein [Variovorax paradoxus]MDP9973268.1 hypothetical protein [Variovorax paradoxus]